MRPRTPTIESGQISTLSKPPQSPAHALALPHAVTTLWSDHSRKARRRMGRYRRRLSHGSRTDFNFRLTIGSQQNPHRTAATYVSSARVLSTHFESALALPHRTRRECAIEAKPRCFVLP